MSQESLDGISWDDYRALHYQRSAPCLGYVGWSWTLEANRGWSPVKIGQTETRRTYRERQKAHYKNGFTIVGNWSWTVGQEKAFHDQWRRFVDDYPGRARGYKKETYKPHVELVSEVTEMLLEFAVDGLIEPDPGWSVDEIVDRIRAMSRRWHADPSEDE